MSVVDLHVESLLDRERVSTLTEAEQKVLDEHLASCVECRFERQLRRDFAGSLRGPVGVDDVDDLIDRVLGDAPAEPVHVSVAATPRRPRLLARTTRQWLVIGGVLLGSAAAAAFVSEPLISQIWPKAEMAESVDPNVTASQQGSAASSNEGTWEPMALYTPSSETALPAAPPPPLPSSTAGNEPSAAMLESASAVFSRANELRHAGKLRAALKWYAALDTKYPESAEARLSKSIVARLLLDQDQATRALQSYDDVLRSDPNGVEALMGRAAALRRLGQRGAEARTLRQVIQAHPNSAHAEAARTRLAELP